MVKNWHTPDRRSMIEHIHYDYECDDSGSTGSAHGDGDGGDGRLVLLFDARGEPVSYTRRKVGF